MSKEKESIPSFKEKCKEAYEKEPVEGTSTNQTPTKEIVKKYCSFFIPLS